MQRYSWKFKANCFSTGKYGKEHIACNISRQFQHTVKTFHVSENLFNYIPLQKFILSTQRKKIRKYPIEKLKLLSVVCGMQLSKHCCNRKFSVNLIGLKYNTVSYYIYTFCEIPSSFPTCRKFINYIHTHAKCIGGDVWLSTFWCIRCIIESVVSKGEFRLHIIPINFFNKLEIKLKWNLAWRNNKRIIKNIHVIL